MLHIYRKRKYYKTNVSSSKFAGALGVTSFCSPQAMPDILTPEDIYINWGVSIIPGWLPGPGTIFINPAESIKISSNKLLMFKEFKRCGIDTYNWYSTGDFLTNRDKSKIHYAREVLTGHSGNGIRIINPEEPIGDLCNLYTEYQPHEKEIRVYVVGKRVVGHAEKKKMGAAKLEALGIEEPNHMIKTNGNGWVFAINDVDPLTEEIKKLAINSIIACGLDFGVVDIAYTDPHKPIAVETNTAPGIDNVTLLNKFASSLLEYINE